MNPANKRKPAVKVPAELAATVRSIIYSDAVNLSGAPLHERAWLRTMELLDSEGYSPRQSRAIWTNIINESYNDETLQ
jgi:hypothetical protein